MIFASLGYMMVTIFKFQEPSYLPKVLQERYLEYFSGSDNRYTRRIVASHPNTPVHVLERLSQGIDMWVNINIAKNPSTPIHILEKLSKSDNLVVKRRAKASLRNRNEADI
jgi:hypothetical protein